MMIAIYIFLGVMVILLYGATIDKIPGRDYEAEAWDEFRRKARDHGDYVETRPPS